MQGEWEGLGARVQRQLRGLWDYEETLKSIGLNAVSKEQADPRESATPRVKRKCRIPVLPYFGQNQLKF